MAGTYGTSLGDSGVMRRNVEAELEVERKLAHDAAAKSAVGGDASAVSGKGSRRGLVALAASFAFNAGILAVWIYVEPLSRQSGHPAGTAGLAMASVIAET